MKIFVIGSAPAVWGFALTGVSGEVVEDAAALNAALDKLLEAEDLGIILMTEDVADMARERVEALMARGEVPLVVEIPGPDGPSPHRSSISDLLDRTMGVKL